MLRLPPPLVAWHVCRLGFRLQLPGHPRGVALLPPAIIVLSATIHMFPTESRHLFPLSVRADAATDAIPRVRCAASATGGRRRTGSRSGASANARPPAGVAATSVTTAGVSLSLFPYQLPPANGTAPFGTLYSLPPPLTYPVLIRLYETYPLWLRVTYSVVERWWGWKVLRTVFSRSPRPSIPRVAGARQPAGAGVAEHQAACSRP